MKINNKITNQIICHETKALTEFYKNKQCNLGVVATCKKCTLLRIGTYREAHLEEVKARSHARYEAHRDEVIAHARAYQDTHSEKVAAIKKIYREANFEKLKALRKQKRESNAEKIRNYAKNYRRCHSEEIKTRSRRWIKANPEKAKAHQKAWCESHPERLKMKQIRFYCSIFIKPLILKRDNYRCRLCGNTQAQELHHIFPVKVSPERVLDPKNLVILCKQCHLYVAHPGGNLKGVNPIIQTELSAIALILEVAHPTKSPLS